MCSCVVFVQNAGWTALFFAMKEGKVEIAKKVLVAGADVHIKDTVHVHLFCCLKVQFTHPIIIARRMF